MTRRSFNLPEEKSAFERHAQSLVAAIILLIVAYIGATIQDIRDQAIKTAAEMGVFQKTVGEKIVSLEIQISNLQTSLQRATEDRFRGSDAANAFAVRDTKVAELESRMRAIEQENAAFKSKHK